MTQRSGLTTTASYAHTGIIRKLHTTVVHLAIHIRNCIAGTGVTFDFLQPNRLQINQAKPTYATTSHGFGKLLTPQHLMGVFGVLCIQIECINLHFTCGAACRECNLYAHFNYFICTHEYLKEPRHSTALNVCAASRSRWLWFNNRHASRHTAHTAGTYPHEVQPQHNSRGKTPPAALHCSHRRARRYERTCAKVHSRESTC